MKITLFGATGKTGRHLIEHALRRGTEVTVFARLNTPYSHPKVRVVRGDLTDVNILKEAIHEADAVISALGPTRTDHPSDLPITRAYEAIIRAMKDLGVKRLITTSTPTASDPGDKSIFTVWFPALLIKIILRSSCNDMITFPKVIRESGLDWTMVRLNILKDRKATNEIYIGLCGRTKHTLTLSREDAAIFMLDQVISREFIQQAPALSNK